MNLKHRKFRLISIAIALNLLWLCLAPYSFCLQLPFSRMKFYSGIQLGDSVRDSRRAVAKRHISCSISLDHTCEFSDWQRIYYVDFCSDSRRICGKGFYYRTFW